MKAKALRDFNSISLKKTFKQGETINEDDNLVKEWINNGMAEAVKAKRQTKEDKSKKQTKAKK